MHAELMEEAVLRATGEGRELRRWEMTDPAWRALMIELEPDRSPQPCRIGEEAPRRLFGVRVAIVPGPKIEWRLIVEPMAKGRDG
jgi:hypothetical protein